MTIAKAFLISLLLAVASGGSLLFYTQRFEAETSGGPKSGVLIATRDIGMGARLDRGMLGVRQVPQAYLEPRHIAVEELESVLGARMSMSVNAGESVLWSDLASMQNTRRDLSGLIEPGMRALAIHTGDTGQFAGLLRPGDRVDVVYSSGGSMSNPNKTVTLLQNVLVLAVGSDTGGSSKTRSRSRAVSVSVSPEQAQAIIHARMSGKLDVALRNPDDTLVLEGLPETGTQALRQADTRLRLSQRVRRAAAIANSVKRPSAVQEPRREIDRVR
ncbi:MAG: Flp pilus assembly protein CpaB [Myxococcales bacterium]|nr:Flp pilus assembly protein CpaB [Myxococcales bacterium]MDD9968208.1 Flp pilus assembly protein CpaB [Myxococcales bacterium]